MLSIPSYTEYNETCEHDAVAKNPFQEFKYQVKEIEKENIEWKIAFMISQKAHVAAMIPPSSEDGAGWIRSTR